MMTNLRPGRVRPRRPAATARLALLAGIALLAGCGGDGGPAGGGTTQSLPPSTSLPPVPAKVIERPAKVGSVDDVPADKVRAALDKTVYLVLTQYADRLVLTGKDSGLISQLSGSGVAPTLRDRPRDRSLLAIRPVFPPSILRLGDPVAEVVRSKFTVRSRRCDFSQLCAGASSPSGLNVHWSGALRYRLTRVADGRPADVAYTVEIDWIYLVQRFPANPVFVAASPELGTARIGAVPILTSCLAKGYLVPPPEAKAPTKADFAPPKRDSLSRGGPGPCPV